MTTETRFDTATAAEIRAKLAEINERLIEAVDAERVATEAVDAARTRRALTGESRAETGLDRAQKQRGEAMESRLGLESAIAQLEKGLQLALTAEHTDATRRWAQRADAERKAVAADQARVVKLLAQIAEALETEEARLLARKEEIDGLGLQAAKEGASWHVGAPRALSQDYRAFRSVLETLHYLKSIRQTN